MHGKTLRGTLKLAWIWAEEATPRQRQTQGKGGIVGTCSLCGRPIRWGESYHVHATGMMHLRCKWQAAGGGAS